jgi:hypothetical protein
MSRYAYNLLFLIILFATTKPAAAAEAAWLAYGDLRAHLEPCGCDPATDMGGVRRIAAFLARERLARPDISVYGLGNTMPVRETEKIKIPFLLEAEATLRPTAVLVNALELRHWDAVTGHTPGIPYVISNLVPTQFRLATVKERIATAQEVIFGYAYDESLRGLVERVDAKMVDLWAKAALRDDPERKKTRVLLFSGGDEELRLVLDAKIFDVVVSSNRAPFDEEPGTREKVDEERLARVKEKDVHMVPLGGQGVLRGGRARFEEAMSLGALLAKPSVTPAPVDANPFGRARLVTWLGREVGGEEQLADLFKRYNRAAQNAFAASAEERLKGLATSPYVGAEACATCHPAAHAVWKESKHAHAMQTLVDRGKHQDGECVQCHVLGAREPGGFVDLDKSPQLANVQCEVCHGPRKEHAADPTKKPQQAVKPAEVCVRCHNAQHSPAFVQDVFWQRIKHGR